MGPALPGPGESDMAAGDMSAGGARRPPVRVVVVRSERRAGSLADRLEAAGLAVVRCPLVEVEPLGDDPVDAECDWLVVTSPNAAEELARRGLSGRPRAVAAVGPGTAEALEEAGIHVDLVPEVATQEGLLAALPRPAGQVVVAAAEGARRLLADELGARFVALYRTTELPAPKPARGDLVALASSSQARAFARLGRPLPVVSIGPQTTAAAEAAGLRVVAEARTHDLPGLVAAVEAAAAAL
jgi:uroporphyrinogen-III synthase